MKRSIVLLILLLFLIGIAACTRSVGPTSTEPVVPTVEEGNGQVPTDDVMGQLELFVTQTAMAQQAAAGTPIATPEVPAETEAEAPETPAEAPAEQPTAEVAPTTPEEVQPSPTPMPQVVVPTPTPGLPANYTLQSGEFPYCIARRFDLNPAQLLSANGLGTNTTVRPGTTLVIPQGAGGFPGNRSLLSHPTTYTVGSNENIYEIACKFGDVHPYQIAVANNLSAPYNLQAGQTLQIP